MSVQFVLTLFGSLIAALLGVAGGIGAWAALRVGRNAQVINNFRTSAESWESVAKSKEQEMEELREENAGLKEQLAEVRGQVAVLTGLVRGAIVQMAGNTPKEVLDKIDDLIRSIEVSRK